MVKILAIGDFHGKFPENLRKEAEKADLILALGDYAGLDFWRDYILYRLNIFAKGKKPEKSAEDFYGKKRFKQLVKMDDDAGKQVLSELDSLKKKIFFLLGNGDDSFYDYPFDKFFKGNIKNIKFLKKLKNLENMTYGKRKFKGIDFIGFGGYIDPVVNFENLDKLEDGNEIRRRLNLRNFKAEKKLRQILKNTGKNRIFVLHYPPFGVFDKIKDKNNPAHGKSAGVKFFTKLIKQYKPRLVLCGHMHEYQGKKKLGKSLVVNQGEANKGKAAVIDWPSLRVRFIK